jgi:hypothetical protein
MSLFCSKEFQFLRRSFHFPAFQASCDPPIYVHVKMSFDLFVFSLFMFYVQEVSRLVSKNCTVAYLVRV